MWKQYLTGRSGEPRETEASTSSQWQSPPVAASQTTASAAGPDQGAPAANEEDLLGLHGGETPVSTQLENNVPSSQDPDSTEPDLIHEDEEYVPPGLASFVRQVDSNLKITQQQFLEISDRPVPSAPSWEDEVVSPKLSNLREDEQDKKLKAQVLAGFEERHRDDALLSQSENTPETAANPLFPAPDDSVPLPKDAQSHMPVPTPFKSPDLLVSPPPNPVATMTDSEIKREVGEGPFFFTPHVAQGQTPFATLPTQEKLSVTIPTPLGTNEVRGESLDHHLTEFVSSMQTDSPEVELEFGSGVPNHAATQAAGITTVEENPERVPMDIEPDHVQHTPGLQAPHVGDIDGTTTVSPDGLVSLTTVENPTPDARKTPAPSRTPAVSNGLTRGTASSQSRRAKATASSRDRRRISGDKKPSPRTDPVSPSSSSLRKSLVKRNSPSVSRKTPAAAAKSRNSPTVSSHLLRGTAASRSGRVSTTVVRKQPARIAATKATPPRTKPAVHSTNFPKAVGQTTVTRPTVSSRLMKSTAASQARASKASPEVRQVARKPRVSSVTSRKSIVASRQSMHRAAANRPTASSRNAPPTAVGRRPASDSNNAVSATTAATRPARPTNVSSRLLQGTSASQARVHQTQMQHQKATLQQRQPVRKQVIATPRLTIPKAPHFATTDLHGEKGATPSTTREGVTLALSTDVLRRGLRQTTPGIRNTREHGVTIPVTPRFHSSAQRELPKSFAEQEKQMMHYYKTHPFKANPVRTFPRSQTVQKPAKRRLTIAEPFHLQTDSRRASSRVREPKDDESKELNKKFKARAMPSFAQPTKSQSTQTRSATKLETSRFASASRVKQQTKSTDEDGVVVKPFRAKPAPKSTFEYTPPQKSPAKRGPTNPEPFHLPGMTRREAQQQEQKRKLEMEQERERKAAEFRAKPVPQTTYSPSVVSPRHADAEHAGRTPTQPEPFAMPGMRLHEATREQQRQQIEAMEQETKRQAEFRAKPVPVTTYRPSILSPRSAEAESAGRTPTKPEPFEMPGMRVHEAMQEQQRQKLAAMEEESRKQAEFRAKPVPSSTYQPSVVSPRVKELQHVEPAAMQPEPFDSSRVREAKREELKRKLAAMEQSTEKRSR